MKNISNQKSTRKVKPSVKSNVATTLNVLEQQAGKALPKQKRQTKSQKQYSKFITIVAIIIFIMLLSLFSGLGSYSVAYIKCGEAPIVVTPNIAGGGAYLMPGDKEYGPGPFNSYLCVDDARLPRVYSDDSR